MRDEQHLDFKVCADFPSLGVTIFFLKEAVFNNQVMKIAVSM